MEFEDNEYNYDADKFITLLYNILLNFLSIKLLTS